MIQKFIVEETRELIYETEKLDEWKEKCQELGLENQLALAETNKSPVPFEFMNEVSKRVYETLCPTSVKYREYKKTPIPLEVLGLIKLSEDEKYFDEIQIWYDDKSPDPLVVGLIKTSEWGHDRYLIAKWADVMRSFEELRQMAIARYKASSALTLKRKISEAQNKLDNVEVNTELYFAAENQTYDVIGF